MNGTIDNWQDKNDQYLSEAIEWLRMKLMKLASSFSNKEHSLAEDTKADAAIAAKAFQMKDTESNEPLPALEFIRRRFGLSVFEHNILLICVSMELDTRIPALCAVAHNDPNKTFPTFALAMALFDEPAWDVVSLQRPLRYWKLVEINRLTGQPLISCPLRADERIINFIKGLNYLDERIVKVSSPFDINANDADITPSQQKKVDEIIKNFQRTNNDQSLVLTQLIGQDPVSKQLIAQKAAFGSGLHLICLPFELLPTQPQELEELARLWQRESMLLRIAGYIDAHKVDPFVKTESGNQAAGFSLQRFLTMSRGFFFLSLKEIYSDLSAFSSVVEIKKPTPLEQRTEWDKLLGERSNDTASELAGQFNLNIMAIRQIVKRATMENGIDQGHLHQKIWNGCLSATSPELDVLVQKIEIKSTWNDIVLPEASENQLRQIASQVKYRSLVYDSWGYREKMNRGLGISALFIGESGTGKTMAAEVLANHLNLQLYKIDLSGVVSKYIGETEKNLRRLFDAAENGGAILFFDEADALFGKRSEVKDSHDRYANIEVNYLLQRMEAYNGLAILATNKKSALDEAFIRRLRFIVHFPFPGTRERKIIAQRVFPSLVPKDKLDYDRLASLNLSGGSLHNVAINASFKAAEEGGPVTMPMILSAARAEFQKMERPIKESDFVWNEG